MHQAPGNGEQSSVQPQQEKKSDFGVVTIQDAKVEEQSGVSSSLTESSNETAITDKITMQEMKKKKESGTIKGEKNPFFT